MSIVYIFVIFDLLLSQIHIFSWLKFRFKFGYHHVDLQIKVDWKGSYYADSIVKSFSFYTIIMITLRRKTLVVELRGRFDINSYEPGHFGYIPTFIRVPISILKVIDICDWTR